MRIDLKDIKPTASLELLARQLVEGFIIGLHKSPYHGFSVEFAEHRLYNEGESIRHIDWKVYARTDKLFTKRYEEETNLRCLIAIDTSPSMFYPSESLAKIRFSKYSAAALAYLLHKQRDAVGVCLFSDEAYYISPIKSSASHLDKVLQSLSNIDAQRPSSGRSNVAGVLHEVAEKINKRSLVVLFSDMFDSSEETTELFKALQHLKHNKHEVILFHVMDHQTEQLFDFEDRPMEFIDLESGERVRLNPLDVKDQYRNEIEKFHASLKMRCHQYKIDFVEVDVRSSFHTILQTYLIKRAKMK